MEMGIKSFSVAIWFCLAVSEHTAYHCKSKIEKQRNLLLLGWSLLKQKPSSLLSGSSKARCLKYQNQIAP